MERNQVYCSCVSGENGTGLVSLVPEKRQAMDDKV
jgi:hypothetical protein